MISGETLVAGIVGASARRSLSPTIHNAWMAAAGIDAVYVAFELAEDGFEPFVWGLRGGTVRGLNVTIPFKEQALIAADEIRPAARAAGAANLLIYQPGGAITADNTDGVGLLEALRGAGWKVADGPVLVVGAGGAAKGAAAALVEAGVPEVRIVNRTPDRAERLAAGVGARAYGWAEMGRAADDAAAIVNATSLGGHGQPVLDLPPAPVSAVVMDMVYRPLETPLLRQARVRGHRTADGLTMLIAQARPSFEAFFGRPAPEGVDVRALCCAAMEAAE
jgi:shikimate dehydrogenase